MARHAAQRVDVEQPATCGGALMTTVTIGAVRSIRTTGGDRGLVAAARSVTLALTLVTPSAETVWDAVPVCMSVAGQR